MENPFQENKLTRPTFLTVLCILTFIGSGWGILSQLFALLGSSLVDSSAQIEQYSAAIDSIEDSGASSFLSGLLSSSQEMLSAALIYAKQIALISLVLYLCSLFGAICMFKLRRIGFWIYAVAQVLMLFVTPCFTGFSLLVVSGMIVGALFTILFIVMYAVNLKYMHR